jgi:hypothetical protein
MPASVDRQGVVVVDPRAAPVSPDSSRLPAVDLADLLLGTAWVATRLSGRLATAGTRGVVPLVCLLARPPMVPRGLQPGQGARWVIERWRRDRPEAARSFANWSATAVPGALDAVLGQLDLRRLVGVVLDHVDLDALVADIVNRLDVEAALANLLSRVDLDRVVNSALGDLDLDAAVSRAIQRVDVARVTAQVLDRLDVDDLVSRVTSTIDLDGLLASVLARVDLPPVVSSALDQLDITQIVLEQLDLQRLVAGVVERLDLTAIVVDQIDLGTVVSAALERVDLTRIVLDQVDLIGIAEYVVDGIDLQEIIRESTGSVASEAVRVMRLQGVEGDVAVARAVDRLLHRHHRRRLDRRPEDSDASTEAHGDSPSATRPGPERKSTR